MLRTFQAPEGPTFNSQRFQDARPSPGGADQKKRIFNVPTAEAVSCGTFAPPESAEEYHLFDGLFDDHLIRKNPRLTSCAQVPARYYIKCRFGNHFHISSASAKVLSEFSV